ncbi:Fc.00g026190.m01.CDS01 [Cosmosporella sp. VM-42]
MADNDLPIALRRSRRSRVKSEPCSSPAGPRMTAKTPRRGGKKSVRFSDPGPSSTSASSGLTPMLRRASVATPRRRHSTPLRGSGNGVLPKSPGLPESGDVTFLPLRQVLDGRVQRRIRRNGMSEEMNNIQQERKQRALETKAEIDQLKAELKARDREIYELQNATIVMDTDRVWDLEKQIEQLRSELDKKSGSNADQTRGYNWTLAARDPFSDDFMDMGPDDEVFGDATMAQLQCSTPSRARSSFPSPPATSPLLPAFPPSSPSSRPVTHMLKSSNVGVQASFADPAQGRLEAEVVSLQLEVCKLTTTLDSYKSLSSRLANRISTAAPASDTDSPASSTEALESQVEALLRSMSDRTAALTQLTSSISDLGFPGSDACEMITSLSSGFRAARLELEYLTPGEIALPLSSHGAEVLDLLLTRLRIMAKKAKEDEDAIDEYHDIEQSLRKQLDARVSVMDGLKAEMSKAEKLMSEKSVRIKELEVANERLKGAVDGYIRDISELEKLVERMESDGRDSNATHQAYLESNRRILSSKEDNIAELEAKLSHALECTADFQRQMVEMQEGKTKDIASLNRKHGTDLALRDARVMELRREIDRVNDMLRAAHETVRGLRVENGGLMSQLDQERNKAKTVIDSMKEELQRVLQISQDFLNTPKPTRQRNSEGETPNEGSTTRPGDYLSAGLARRRSKNMRRRHDSGLYLLDEDEVDMF